MAQFDFEVDLSDIMSDVNLIEQARQAAKAEAEAYKKRKEEELRRLAFEQLKEKFLAEEKAKIDKEFEEKATSLQSQINSLKEENKMKDQQIENLKKELEETKELQQKLSSTLTNDQKNQVIRQLYNKGIILTADDYYNDFIDEHSEELDFAEAQRKLEEHKQRLEQEIIDFENEEFEENPFAVNLN